MKEELKKLCEKTQINNDLESPEDKVIDYVISVYSKNGEQASEMKLANRKEFAIKKYKIKKSDADILKRNKSDYVSFLVTALMKIQREMEFELYISAMEASTILLDVVRRPIADSLEDEKWYSALKAKKLGFLDAQELIREAKKLSQLMTGVKDNDIDDNISDSEFKGGVMERLAQARKDTK